MKQYSIKNDVKVLIENKPKFFPVHASSGFKHSLREVLQDPAVQARLADTKAAQEASMEYGWWEGRKEEEETTLLHRPLENRFFNYLGLG